MIYEIRVFYPYNNTLRVEGTKTNLKDAKKLATKLSRMRLYGSSFVQVWKQNVRYEDDGLVHEIA